MTFQDTVSIYLDGYRTNGGHKLEKWFEARGKLFGEKEYSKKFQAFKSQANADARGVTKGR
jgi:hypothetical protein